MMNTGELLRESINRLKEGGIANPHLDAHILVAHALGIERFKLIVDESRPVAAEAGRAVKRLISRRLKFEPVAYITGKKEFYSLDFSVTKSVLIPRPETELLVDLAVYYAPQYAAVLDIGTGSGAIAIAFKTNRRDCDVYASDLSDKALAVARRNGRVLLGSGEITFKKGDLFAPVKNMRFHLIVSNPPYVDPSIEDTLQPDLAFEPRIALYSKNNGRHHLQKIIAGAGRYLKGNGICLLEIGGEMKEFIEDTGKSNGFSVSVMNDYSGIPRVAVLKQLLPAHDRG